MTKYYFTNKAVEDCFQEIHDLYTVLWIIFYLQNKSYKDINAC